MKSPTDIKGIFLAVCFTVSIQFSFGQSVQTNPDQETAIINGNAKINSSINKQSKDMAKVAALQGAMGAQFKQIGTWERKYNSYLKTARGYAETMKAGTMLYLDGMRIIRSLFEVKNAVNANKQGIAATMFMNNLYMETATEFIRTYRLLQTTVAKGGKENMLNGAERNEMLWSIVERMEALHQKLHSLAISIAYYNLGDVWRKATAGLVPVDHGLIARDAIRRWKRASKIQIMLNLNN